MAKYLDLSSKCGDLSSERYKEHILLTEARVSTMTF